MLWPISWLIFTSMRGNDSHWKSDCKIFRLFLLFFFHNPPPPLKHIGSKRVSHYHCGIEPPPGQWALDTNWIMLLQSKSSTCYMCHNIQNILTRTDGSLIQFVVITQHWVGGYKRIIVGRVSEMMHKQPEKKIMKQHDTTSGWGII